MLSFSFANATVLLAPQGEIADLEMLVDKTVNKKGRLGRVIHNLAFESEKVRENEPIFLVRSMYCETGARPTPGRWAISPSAMPVCISQAVRARSSVL